MTTNQTERVSDEELDQMILKLERDGMTPKQLSLMRELREVRREKGEPVAWDYEWASCITCEGPQDFKRIIEHEAPPEWAVEEGQARNIIPLYTVPPAPVVPDELTREEYKRRFMADDCFDNTFRGGWNACRAAMLQADALTNEDTMQLSGNSEQLEPVSNRDELPFEQWLSQQSEKIDVDCGCISIEAFMCWMRKAYEAGNSPVTPDGWVMVPAELTQDMRAAWDSAPNTDDDDHNMQAAYRAMITAAPKEVGDGK